MNSAIGMQNSLESILSVLKSIIRSKNFNTFGKLSSNARDRGRPSNNKMNKVKDISGYRFTSIEKQSWLFS